MSYKWDGLAGNRISDDASKVVEWQEALGTYDTIDDKFSLNSGAGLHIVPTSNMVYAVDNATADGVLDTVAYKQNVKEPQTQSPSKFYSTAGSKGGWSVSNDDIPLNEFTVSLIISPTAYPYPEFLLGAYTNENIELQIANDEDKTLLELGDEVQYIGVDKGTIPVDAVTGNSVNNNANSFLGFQADSDEDVKNLVGDYLARIPSNSSNGGLTNAEYCRVTPHEDSGEANRSASVYIGTYTAGGESSTGGWSSWGEIGLYGTGSVAGGGGTGGVPTDEGNITIIPRSIIFRMGNYIGIHGTGHTQGRAKFVLPMRNEKLLCFLDSNGLVNVWMKAKNQNLWLKIQSSKAVPKDGITPTHLSVTFDKDLPRANLKLYINGKLDAYTGDRATTGTETQLQDDADGQGGEPIDWALSGSEEFMIDIMGRLAHQHWNGNISPYDGYGEIMKDGFYGRMEEFVFLPYSTYYINPQKESLVIEKPFADLRDTDYAEPKTYFAKMFIKDYHNIRGTTADEVRQTNNVSWRKTAFKLNMS